MLANENKHSNSLLASNTTLYPFEHQLIAVSLSDVEAHSKDQTDAAEMKNGHQIGADLSGAKHKCAQPSLVVSYAFGNFRRLSIAVGRINVDCLSDHVVFGSRFTAKVSCAERLLVSNQIDLIGSCYSRALLNNGSPLPGVSASPAFISVS